MLAEGSPKRCLCSRKARRLNPYIDQEISFEGSIPCIRWSSASGEQVPLTPPQVAILNYQALIDVTSELNKWLGSEDFDKHGHAKGDGKVKL